ncbi:MAG: thioredoxin family protein [Thermofilaceae archaeon]
MKVLEQYSWWQRERRKYHPLISRNRVMAKLVVYVCREPNHDKLVEMVKDVLDRVKGKKPKLQVVRLKLERSEDFPAYLSQLEELFGGVATAEFRKYRIESLPAIVYNDQLVLQGSVPSLEELEEALAYAGLKFSKKSAVAVQLPVQTQLPYPIQSGMMTGTPAHLATAKSGEETQARRVPQPPPRIKIIDRLSPPIEEAERTVKAEESASSEARISQPTKPQEPLLRPAQKPAPQETQAKAVQLPEKRPPPLGTTPPPPLEKQITEEELLINVPPAAPASLQARRRKLCRDCMFYEPTARRCLLYRAPINDPEKPICA